jgi:hypothetical protein
MLIPKTITNAPEAMMIIFTKSNEGAHIWWIIILDGSCNYPSYETRIDVHGRGALEGVRHWS